MKGAVQRARVRQLDLDWRLGPATRTMFRVDEAADILGLSRRTVEDLLDAGQLFGHEHNAAGQGKRMTRRVARASLSAYLARTATYDAEQIFQAATELADTLSRDDLAELAQHCQREAARRNR